MHYFCWCRSIVKNEIPRRKVSCCNINIFCLQFLLRDLYFRHFRRARRDHTDSKSLLRSTHAAKTRRTEPCPLFHWTDKYAFKSMHSLVHTYMMHREWGRGLSEWSNTSFPSMCRTVHLRLLLKMLNPCHLRYICATCMSPRFITEHRKIQSYQSLALRKSQGAEPCACVLRWGKNQLCFSFFCSIAPVFPLVRTK